VFLQYKSTKPARAQVMELGGCDFFDLTNGRRVRDPLLRRDYFRQMCLCTLQLHQVRARSHMGQMRSKPIDV
jgi:hypothetical protein